jgi:ABC-type glycerol-3-phosphate transport system substrate-binding protein
MRYLLICLSVFFTSHIQAQTTITFWHSQDATSELIQSFADAFNASQSEYRVEPRLTGSYQESAIRLVAALGTESAPVMFDAEGTVFSRLFEEGALVELSQHVAALDEALINDIYPVMWEFGAFGDGRYGLPWNVSAPVLFYNRNIFEQRGLTPPTTWEEFEAAAQSLTTRNTRGYIDVAAAFIFETLVASRGGAIVTEDGQPNFNSPEAVEALTQLQRMAQARTSVPRGFGELDQALIDFARTRAMMAIASQAFFPQGERFAVGFEVGQAPVPQGSAATVPMIGAQLVVVNSATEAQAAGAVAFWAFLMAPENLAAWVQASYFLPVRQSVAEQLEPWYAEDPNRRAGLDQLDNLVMRPRVGAYAIWQGYLQEAIERATKAGADPATVLGEAQQRALASP